MTQQAQQPQLVMWYRAAEPPRMPPLPEGYELRCYRSGDEPGWEALLNANKQLGVWSAERIQGELDGALVRSGQQFVLCGERIVATAGVYDRRLEERDAWEIGWVASHPEHRGRGIGAQVTAAAVAVALGLPKRPIYLRTDDFRVQALKVYLKLGFTPDLRHPSYRSRWEELTGTLGVEYGALVRQALTAHD